MQDLVLPKPSSPCIPKIWKYDDIEDILEAGDIISTEEAERRVLILENQDYPGLQELGHFMLGCN